MKLSLSLLLQLLSTLKKMLQYYITITIAINITITMTIITIFNYNNNNNKNIIVVVNLHWMRLLQMSEVYNLQYDNI